MSDNLEQKNLMGSVDQRTQLAGQNRMELLIFSLGDNGQKFGINVFKVREVILCPKITGIPHAGSNVLGMANVRGETIPIIDLSAAVDVSGQRVPEDIDENNPPLMIVTEYNTRTQAFLVQGVDRIINKSWEEITPPPENLPNGHYLTATTQVDKDIVGILDVERVLSEMDPAMKEGLSDDMVQSTKDWNSNKEDNRKVMVVDDSSVARKQLERCLNEMSLPVATFNDGKEALDHLLELEAQGKRPEDIYRSIISDIEMPRMDGYTFVTNVRNHAQLRDIKIVLHSSLSGGFNEALVQKVGADGFIAKFDPDRLAQAVIEVTG